MVTIVVALLASGGVLATGNTDVLFIGATIALFAVGMAYAEGCEKL